MLRRVKHLRKKAAKYRFTASLNQLDVQGTKSWQPYKLVIVWTRRKKRTCTTAQSWRPGIENPYKGIITWSGQKQESLEILVTLFQDHGSSGYEPKDWVFVLENESRDGRRKPVATARLDMAQYVTEVPTQQIINIPLKPLSGKLASAKLTFELACVLMSVGPATEADLVSMAGSTTSEDTIRLGNIDIGNIRDLDDQDAGSSRTSSICGNADNPTTHQELRNLTNQIEALNRVTDEQVHDITSNSSRNGQSTRSRHSSINSTRSESASVRSRSSFHKGIVMGGVVEEIAADDSEVVVNRSSASSDSSEEPSSVQKRRLRSSADFLPTTEMESSPIQGSPAPDQEKSLLLWCQVATAGHRGVKVTNFTTSWRNGLALCAVLHHYEPSLIAYDELNALDGKTNVRKAMEGFRSLGIMCASSSRHSPVFNKNQLISFLQVVRKHFHDEDDTDEVDVVPDLPSPAIITSSPHPHAARRGLPINVLNLCETARTKLLSDLEEKEVEDDVFSAALDEVLESSLVEDSPHTAMERPETSLSSGSEVFISPKQREGSSLRNHLEELRKISVIPNNSGPDTVPLDVVLTSLNSGDTSSSHQTKSGMGGGILSRVASDLTRNDPVEDPHVEEGDVDRSLIDSGNPFGDSLEFFSENKVFSSDEARFQIPSVQDDTSEKESEFTVQIHISSSEPTKILSEPSIIDDSAIECPYDVSSREEVVAMDEFIAKDPVLECEESDQSKHSISGEDIVIERECDDVNTVERNESPNIVQTPTLEKVMLSEGEPLLSDASVQAEHDVNITTPTEPESTASVETFSSEMDVVVKLPVVHQQEDKSKDDDFQDTVDRLLKSSAARSRKAKAMELLEKARMETVNPTSDVKEEIKSAEELKRQEEVRQRAQQLIEETRATLGRAKKLVDDHDIDRDNTSTTSSIPSSDRLSTSTDQKSPSVSSLNAFPTSPPISPSLNIQSSSICSETEQEFTTSPSGSMQIEVPPSTLDIDDRLVESLATEVIPQTPTPPRTPTSAPPDGSSDYVDDPLRQNHSSNLPDALVQVNGMSPPSLVKMRNQHHTTKPDLETGTLPADPDPLFSLSSTTSHPDTSPVTNPALIDRMPVTGTSEIHKRWSVAMAKKSTSSLPEGTDDMETERLALDREMKTVEERSMEVQVELHEIKSLGRRADKRREAELTQEWFQLVNKKNAILRQQDQLALMEEENMILRRVETIHEELIPLMEIEEAMKTAAQKERELLLLEEKVRLVNKRDRVVQDMNEKEQTALDEEELLQANLGQNMSSVMQQDDKCVVM